MTIVKGIEAPSLESHQPSDHQNRASERLSRILGDETLLQLVDKYEKSQTSWDNLGFESGGRRGIRTLDTESPYAAFPGRYNQPLCHPSVDVS